jgi:superfamily II DNA/RNA helicase
MSHYANFNRQSRDQEGRGRGDRDRNNDRNGDRGYDRNSDRSRLKGIRPERKPLITAEQANEKFNYAANALNLMEKEDIFCSPEVIDDECKEFDDMNGKIGLKEELYRGIIAHGFEVPSKIQGYAIPQILKGREILAQSQSGTGKTGAFIISSLQIVDEELKKPQVIILSPTCDLAHQTWVVGKGISQFMTNINFSFTVGGCDRVNNIRELGGSYHGKTDENISQIIIATPGRLIDIIQEFPHLFDSIKLLIIDECDELLSGNFKEELKKIIKALPETLQICLFSATLTDETVALADKILQDSIKILIKKEKMTLDGIKQTCIDVESSEEKLTVLIDMLQSLPVQKFIVYVNSIRNVEILQKFLEDENYQVLTINSQMTKFQRAEVIRDFKKGTTKCLISTDLLSRGIDIQQLSLVINYDLPRAENIQCYIHRIGRTGRFGRKGLAINLVNKYEKQIINLISLTFKVEIESLKKKDLEFIK